MNGINTTYIKGYADSITGIINGILVPLLIAVAFIVFLWGIYKYFIKGADNEKERETGRVFTLYGVIGFVIIFSVWGIVQIFMSTLNLKATNAPPSPTINTGPYAPGGSGSPGTSNQTVSNSGSGTFTSWLFGGGTANPTGSGGGGTGGGSSGGFFTTIGNWFGGGGNTNQTGGGGGSVPSAGGGSSGTHSASGGCIDPNAVGQNADGSCMYDSGNGAGSVPPGTVTGGSDYSGVPGCTDPNANNYNSGATVDDGTCVTPDYGSYI